MFELEKKSIESIEDRVKWLYDEISRTKSVVIGNKTYRVDDVAVLKGRGIISGWEVIVEGDPSSYSYVIRDRDERTYMTILMKKPGIVIGVGLSPDRNHAVIIYDT